MDASCGLPPGVRDRGGGSGLGPGPVHSWYAACSLLGGLLVWTRRVRLGREGSVVVTVDPWRLMVGLMGTPVGSVEVVGSDQSQDQRKIPCPSPPTWRLAQGDAGFKLLKWEALSNGRGSPFLSPPVWLPVRPEGGELSTNGSAPLEENGLCAHQRVRAGCAHPDR